MREQYERFRITILFIDIVLWRSLCRDRGTEYNYGSCSVRVLAMYKWHNNTIYINWYQFAYDCLLYRTIHSFQDHIALQNDLHELETWAKNWGMHFNSKKCYILSVHQNSKFFYTLNGDILKQVEDNPYLGVHLSEDMKGHKHISNVTKKASQTLGFLRRNLAPVL